MKTKKDVEERLELLNGIGVSAIKAGTFQLVIVTPFLVADVIQDFYLGHDFDVTLLAVCLSVPLLAICLGLVSHLYASRKLTPLNETCSL